MERLPHMRIISSLLAAFLLTFAARSAAAQGKAAEMTINDSFTGAGLHSDGNGPYLDNSLTGGSPCVTAQVTSNGIFSNRIDFNSVLYPEDCDSTLTPSPVRTFTLTLGDSTGCLRLTGSSTAPCSVTIGGNYIDKTFAGTLFASNGTSKSTGVFFDFVYGGNTYRLSANNSASVTHSGNTATATYSGEATLYQMSTNGKFKPVTGSSSFSFPFQFTVTTP